MICLSVEEKSRLETKLRELLMEKSLCLNSCSPKKSMEIYNLVYSYCIKLRKCKKKAVRSLVEVNNSTLDKNEIIGKEIFSILKNFVIRHLKVACLELNNYKGVSLLESYNEYWNKFLIFITIADAGFGYINKFCNIGKFGINSDKNKPIKAMLLNQFKEHFFLNLLYPTRSTVLELINNERNLGITYNSLLISSVLKSYIFMGMANSDALNYEEYLVVYTLKSFDLPEINIYVDFFERKYLEEITVFYCQKSTEYLQNNSLLHYFIYINKIIKDEQDRCLRYMSPQTSNKVNEVLGKVLVENHISVISNFFNEIIINEQYDSLSQIYNLCKDIILAKNEFSLVFTRNINDYGRKFIDECAETDIKDSVMYIQKLVEVYNNFKDIVDRCFENDLSFLFSIDKAFYHIVNENAFLLKYDNKNKNAEFFAKYADFILKKCSKIPESEIMEKISSLMAIFNFLTEKDIFLNFYIRYYAKRLINNTSVGEEYENELIGRLKYICGFDFTLKLEKMRKDMVISKEFSKSFRDQLLTKGIEKPNFSVNILTKFTWPYKQKIICNLPSDLNLLWNEFEGHYTNFYNSRKLNILSDISWGEVQSNCFKKHHIFRCCIPQISILMIYNDKNEATFKEIKNILNSNDSDVKLIIGPLVKRKLLNISYEFDNTNITDDTIFALNTNFLKNKTFIDMTKIDNATSTTNNSSSTIMNVEKERIYFLEAVIVRIMKARKELKHQQLVAETLCQVKYRFNPEIKQIKKCINNLIEKEYLKRKETDREVYQYLL